MSDESEAPDAEEFIDVNYEFETSNNHQEVFANRVAGGWENGMTLAIHFFIESATLPDSELRRHFRDGRVEIREQEKQENTQKRKRMVTVHMPLDEVQDFKAWLEQQLEDLKRAGVREGIVESEDEPDDHTT